MSKVGVVGAGQMGSEIALVFALGGHEVKICDQSRAQAEKAIERVRGVLAREVEKGRCDPAAADQALTRLQAADGPEDYGDRELVVEAVFENAEVKGDIYRRLEAVLPQSAIIATNTSSISITVLSANLSPERRARFLGTHFFSPVSRMKLVEVIPGLDTSPRVVDEVMDVLKGVGKAPVRIKDVVGFAVNRLLHIFFIEAIRLAEEGVASPEDIDTACKLGLGHPVGPFELMDATKNNLGLEVQEILRLNYGDRFMPRQLLRAMVQAGYNGKQAGRGWYDYPDGKRTPRKAPV